MKWKVKKSPRHCTIRVRREFAWFPTKCVDENFDDTWVWLEKYTHIQKYGYYRWTTDYRFSETDLEHPFVVGRIESLSENVVWENEYEIRQNKIDVSQFLTHPTLTLKSNIQTSDDFSHDVNLTVVKK